MILQVRICLLVTLIFGQSWIQISPDDPDELVIFRDESHGFFLAKVQKIQLFPKKQATCTIPWNNSLDTPWIY